MQNIMNRKTLIGLIALVCIVMAVYYLIPGYNHFLIPANDSPMHTHLKHVALFIGLAIVDIVFGRIMLNSSSPTSEKQSE